MKKLQIEQYPLLCETYEDAIRATILGLGGFKVVGVALRPEMLPDEAGRWLNDTLNPGKRDQLHIRQLALLRARGREKGIDTLATFEMRQAGYADPQPLVVEDEKAKLLREVVRTGERMEQMMAELRRLTTIEQSAGSIA